LELENAEMRLSAWSMIASDLVWQPVSSKVQDPMIEIHLVMFISRKRPDRRPGQDFFTMEAII
jgi:hypothetical protein